VRASGIFSFKIKNFKTDSQQRVEHLAGLSGLESVMRRVQVTDGNITDFVRVADLACS